MVCNLLQALAQKISTTRSFSYGIKTLFSHLKLTKEGFYLKLQLERTPRLKLDNFYAQKTKFLQQQPVTAFT
jgi:hypothetical protein